MDLIKDCELCIYGPNYKKTCKFSQIDFSDNSTKYTLLTSGKKEHIQIKEEALKVKEKGICTYFDDGSPKLDNLSRIFYRQLDGDNNEKQNHETEII